MGTVDGTSDPSADPIDRLADAIRDSTRVSSDLAGAVQASEHRRRRNAQIGGVIAVLLLVGTVGILVGVVQLKGNQVAIRQTQAAIADCTDLERPSAECARRSQANTARAVRAIGDAQAAIAYAVSVCERATRAPDDLRECVEAELAAIAAGTTKAPRLPTPTAN